MNKFIALNESDSKWHQQKILQESKIKIPSHVQDIIINLHDALTDIEHDRGRELLHTLRYASGEGYGETELYSGTLDEVDYIVIRRVIDGPEEGTSYRRPGDTHEYFLQRRLGYWSSAENHEEQEINLAAYERGDHMGMIQNIILVPDDWDNDGYIERDLEDLASSDGAMDNDYGQDAEDLSTKLDTALGDDEIAPGHIYSRAAIKKMIAADKAEKHAKVDRWTQIGDELDLDDEIAKRPKKKKKKVVGKDSRSTGLELDEIKRYVRQYLLENNVIDLAAYRKKKEEKIQTNILGPSSGPIFKEMVDFMMQSPVHIRMNVGRIMLSFFYKQKNWPDARSGMLLDGFEAAGVIEILGNNRIVKLTALGRTAYEQEQNR
jgi:hypothetical protein